MKINGMEYDVTIEWVRPSEMWVDAGHTQRDPKARQAKINKMVREWDWDRFIASLPMNGSKVRRPDGERVAVTDGGGRREALTLMGYDEPIPVAVVSHTSTKQRATQLLALNDGVPLKKSDIHRVGLLAEREDSRAVAETLEKLDLTTSHVQSIGTCYKVLAGHGRDGLFGALYVLTEAFGKSRESYRSELLLATASALADSAVDVSDLVATLAEHQPSWWADESKKRGGWFAAVVYRYNRGRRGRGCLIPPRQATHD